MSKKPFIKIINYFIESKLISAYIKLSSIVLSERIIKKIIGEKNIKRFKLINIIFFNS